MDLAFVILAIALVVAAGIAVFAVLRRPTPVPLSDPRLDDVIRGQGNITGQFQQTLDAQARLQTMLAERIEALDRRLGETLTDSATKTAATITSIGERLTVIDEAQKNITELSGHVVSLKAIFSDKQARGAIAQDQMEAIVAEHLAPDQYEFQATLSNGKRPDCAIRIPNVQARIVVDSKFPWEGFEALRTAGTEEARKTAMSRIRGDMQQHVKDITEKYLIPGEVQAPIVMFVPSDSIYAELHVHFPELLSRARQSQVVIVSPHVFMLVIATIQGLMRDARMREQASLIQKEVGQLSKDVKLLADATEKLQRHMGQADGDIKDILVRSGRIVSRADKIEKVELSGPDDTKTLPAK